MRWSGSWSRIIVRVDTNCYINGSTIIGVAKVQIFRLFVIDSSAPNWRGSIYKDEVIVRAKNENSARMMAFRAFGKAMGRRPGEKVLMIPWMERNIVGCEIFRDKKYEIGGNEAVLSPPTINEYLV